MSHGSRMSGAWAAALAAALLCSCASGREQDREAFDRDVERMVDRVEEAWNTGDADALADLFTSDADLRDPEGRWISGRDEIRGYLKGWMGRRDGVAKEIEVARQRRVGDDAGFVDVVSVLRDPRQREPVERFEVSALVRQEGEAWRFVAWRVTRGAGGSPRP